MLEEKDPKLWSVTDGLPKVRFPLSATIILLFGLLSRPLSLRTPKDKTTRLWGILW